MKHKMGIFIAALAGAFLWAACGHSPRELPATAAALPAGARLAQARMETVPTYIAVAGVVEARRQAQLAPRIAGTVARVSADLGSRVKQGQILAVLQAPELRARQQRAARQLLSAQASTLALEAAVRQARLQWRLAQDTAARYARLWRHQAVSPHEYEQVRMAAAQARARLKQAEQARAAARAQQAAQAAGAEEARQWARDREIRAPFTGVITARNVNPGDLAGPGTPMFTLAAPGRVRVNAWVPVRWAMTLQSGERIELAAAGRRVESRIDAIAPAVDPQSHTVMIHAALAPGVFPIGAYVRVMLPGAKRPALVVPRGAVIRRDGLTQMLVINRHREPELRLVRIGNAAADEITILAGLKAGEIYVVNAGALHA